MKRYRGQTIAGKILALLCLLAVFIGDVRADDDPEGAGAPAPESAEGILTSFERRALEGEQMVETAFFEILEKSNVNLKLRNYYLSRTRPGNTDPKAWTQGGSVEYKVDKVGGFFGLSAEYFGSFKLYGPDEHDGTLLLEPSQNNIDTLGVLNPRATYAGHIFSAFRQKIDLPYLNSQDNRMIPNTFEAYTLSMPKSENETFQYGIGYVDSIKTRNNENFNSMSDVAGVTSKETGLILGAARVFFMPELSLGAANYYVEDVINIAYSELAHKLKINDNLANTFSAQYSYQGSVGEDLLRGEQFDTNAWGVQNAVSYRNAILKFAYTSNDTGGDLRSPYGSYPGYNSVAVEDFNRAGEEAWQIGLSYNFARFGFKELGLSTAYISGSGAINESTKARIPDKDETDVTIDYKVSEGMLEGFWVRLRAALIDEESRGTTKDYRVIVNYEIPLYKASTSS